jgi:hypothetical protein
LGTPCRFDTETGILEIQLGLNLSYSTILFLLVSGIYSFKKNTKQQNLDYSNQVEIDTICLNIVKDLKEVNTFIIRKEVCNFLFDNLNENNKLRIINFMNIKINKTKLL